MVNTTGRGRGRVATRLGWCAFAGLVTILAGVVEAAPSAPRYALDHVLVRFRAGTSPGTKAGVRVVVGGARKKAYDLVPDLELLTIPPGGRSINRTIRALSQRAEVAMAEPDYVVEPSMVPNDPQFSALWGMNSTAQPDADINAPAAWTLSRGDSNMVVAVIDSGIDYTHPDLAANIWTNPGEIPGNGIDDDQNGYVDDVHGYNFIDTGTPDPLDDTGHGTHVAGTIGAVGNNRVGVVGVNWNVKLMALKFMDASGGFTSDAIEAIQYATRMGVLVSNNSWGGLGYSQLLYDAIDAARAAGQIFVAPAGNAGTDNDVSPEYPASFALDNIISVAAIDNAASPASFSNVGATTVDLGAPGVSILSTTPNTSYGYRSGTSMAAAHVAGAVALLYAGCPGVRYGAVRNLVLNNARPLTALAGLTVTGGTLDLNAAVADAARLGCFAQTKPQVTIITPADGATLAGVVTLAASPGVAADLAVQGVQFLVDETMIGTDRDGRDGWSTTWDTTLVGNGAHTLAAIVTDAAGQTGSDTNAVTVHNVATMHVGRLEGVARGKSNWTALVTVTVHDRLEQPLADVWVTGEFSGGAYGSVGCVTDARGRCILGRADISYRRKYVRLAVTGLARNGLSYRATANHNPAPDLLGTGVVVQNFKFRKRSLRRLFTIR